MHIVAAAIDCGEFPISGSHATYCRQEIGVVSQWGGSLPCRIFLFCGFFDNTVFLFVGDHGIPGDAGNMFPRAWTDQRITMEHVPLLIYAPKLLAPTRNPAICSQVDVLPTLADPGDYYYRMQLKIGKEEMVSGPVKDDIRKPTEGIYETAR